MQPAAQVLQPRCKVPSFDSPLPSLPSRSSLPSVRPSAEFINFFEGEFVDEVSEKADGASE